jgi:site-specific DNA recombinase
MVATHTRPSKSPTVPIRQIRCAIYTRKSTDENLNSSFNSLDAQRAAAESYIASQRAEGWVALETRYDDAAVSAATTDRPALQRLLADIETGKIDAVVVYKIDRLSRSLRDFGRLIETFEQNAVAFVSVTQRFDTSSSMGKLTLNVLMSFAEFEREVTRERILDKVAAAKRRGRHCGGAPVLGFAVLDKRLVVVPEEAALVRRIFERFVALRSTTRLAEELNEAGCRTKSWQTVTGRIVGGHDWSKKDLYKLLHNVKLIGRVPHRGETFPGEHEAIISKDLWDNAHAILSAQHMAPGSTRHESTALLRGIIRCSSCDCSMSPSFTTRRGRRYAFYRCTGAAKRGHATCPVGSVSAGAIEAAVVSQLRVVFRSPEIVARTYRESKLREAEEIDRLRADGNEAEARVLAAHAISENEVVEALKRFDSIWTELFPAEQARLVGLLVERVDVSPDGLELRLRGDGLDSLLAELKAKNTEAMACP